MVVCTRTDVSNRRVRGEDEGFGTARVYILRENGKLARHLRIVVKQLLLAVTSSTQGSELEMVAHGMRTRRHATIALSPPFSQRINDECHEALNLSSLAVGNKCCNVYSITLNWPHFSY